MYDYFLQHIAMIDVPLYACIWILTKVFAPLSEGSKQMVRNILLLLLLFVLQIRFYGARFFHPIPSFDSAFCILLQ
jgi:Na+/citrate or Na+/malate symporter